MDTKLSHNRFSYYTGLILSFAGISSAILGLIVLFGWHTGNDTIIRIYPSFPVVPYNTALSFILCGISILGLIFRWKLFSIVTASVVLIISIVNIAEYITGLDLLIDKLFMYPSLHEKIQFPGRIPPNTALNFLLTVASIYGLSLTIRQTTFRVTNFITGILGSLINTFACITIFGYITGLTGIYNWGYFSGMGMTLTAATGFLILGSGIIASSWYEEHESWTIRVGTPSWLPVAILICSSTVTINIWLALNFENGLDLYDPLDEVIMLLGLVSGILMATVVYFYQRLKINTKNIEYANMQLKVEIEVRKQIEQHLKKAQQIARMGSWEWNLITNHLSWSENIFHIFGMPVSEFGATYEAFLNSIHPDDRDYVIKSVNEALNENKPYSINHRIVHPDGTLRVVHEQGEVTFDNNNKPVMMIGTVQDITEHNMLEQQLIESQKMEAVGQLTGGIAHDFNNMLTAIVGYMSLLKLKTSDNHSLKSYIDKVFTITDRASELIQSLMIFSRKQEVTYSPLELNKFIIESSNLISKLVTENIAFRIIPSKEELIITANSGQILQVIMNLVKNSVDAIHSRGAITISVEAVHLNDDFIKAYGYRSAGKHACVSVTDTGAGIAEDFSSKIFDPFFTTKEVGKGTGLGLSVVYGIIKGHNAYINVMSREGKGTTFKIYFPVVEQPAIKTERNVELIPAKGTETILIAEDDEDIPDVMKSVLEESGYNIIIATDGEDAVNKFKKNRSVIHLVILDVIMPKKNGVEVYKEIMKISPQIKAIFMSGYTKEIISTQQFPEKDFLLMEKPVKPGDLARRVKEVLT